MQSVYSTALANWAIRHLLGAGTYPLAEMQSVYSTALANWAIGHTFGKNLTLLQRCNRCILHFSQLSHRTLVWEETYPPAEMQSVYSSVLANWAIGDSLGKRLTLLQICNRCILHFSQLSHRTLVWEETYPPAEMQSVYSTVLANWAIWHALGKNLTLLQRCNRCILQPLLG